MELRMDGYTPNGLLYGGWNRLWNELGREMERSGEGSLSPRAEVVEDGEGYHFSFEMPGLKAGSMDVQIEDGALIVEADRERAEWPKESTTRVSERSYGKLHRAFELPDDARNEDIHASYRDGILSVMVPKRPESKPLKVKVEFAN